MWRLVPLAAAAMLMCACAAKSTRSAQSSAPSMAPQDADAAGAEAPSWQLTRKEDIQTHWTEISRLRKDHLGLDSEPGVLPANLLSSEVLELRTCEASQEPADTQQCKDVCSVKDAICDNAEDICRIAEELGDDAWANEKCVSSKASCKEAKELCCGCVNGD